MRREALVIVVASLWMAAFVQVPSQAEIITPTVVFGNLGPDGTGALSNTSTTTTGTGTGGADQRLAVGFTTGTISSQLSLYTVSLGIAAPVGQSGLRTLGLYLNNGGNPGSLVQNSFPVNVGSKGTYTFSFASPWVDLQASTTYWLVPSDPILWYTNETFSQPVPENSSGYSHAGTREFGVGDTWSAEFAPYAISVVAVPEQGGLPLACIGLVGVAWACRGRKRRPDACDLESGV